MDHLAMWDGNYSTDQREPTCQRSLFAAPQRASDSATLNVVDSIKKFCSEFGQKTLNRPRDGTKPLVDTWDIVTNMYAMSANQSFWLSANMVLDDTHADSGCDQPNTTMSTPECERMLNFAMNHCDPNSGNTHGASIRTDCIAYVSFIGSPEHRERIHDGRALTEGQNITLDRDGIQSPESPPWHSEDRAWFTGGKCNLDAPRWHYTNTWENEYPKFCAYQSDPGRNYTMRDQIEYMDLSTPGDLDPSRRSFRFVPNPQGGACRLTCSEAYDTIAKGACKSSWRASAAKCIASRY